MAKSRKKFDAAFKAKVALEALREDLDGSGWPEHADLDLNHVEPASVLRRVGNSSRPSTRRSAESGGGLGEEVVEDDADALGFWETSTGRRPDLRTSLTNPNLSDQCAGAELITGEGTLDKPEAGSNFDAVNARI